MAKLKFGIIGNGSIARKHIDLIKNKFPNSYISVLIHKRKFKSKFDIIFFSSDELFFKKNYDFVFICNPSSRHIEYINKCIKYNIKNVFVEKPISNNLIQVKNLIKKTPHIQNSFLIGYVLLFNKLFIKTRRLLNEKKLGKLISATIVCNSNFKNWRKEIKFYKTVSSKKNLGGGVLNELSHELSYAISLFEPIKNVFAKLSYLGKKKIDVETNAKMICNTKKNLNFGIFINFLSDKEERYCEIIGTKANLLLDFKHKALYLNNKKILYISDKDKNHMYNAQLNFFVSKNKNKNKIIYNKFNNAIETIKLIKAIQHSNAKKKIVRLI
jgi:predicted dehydrogenase